MTELTDLANSIAQSKEEIRQAIEERGMPCSVSVPLADYADKIRNMTVTNYVDSIYAVNYTGATVSEGDKVFLNKKGLDSTTSFRTIKSTTVNYGYMCLVDTSGNNTWQSYDGYIYDTNSENIIASSATVHTESSSGSTNSFALTQYFPKYDSYGRMYWRNYVFQNGIVTERSTIFLNDDYDLKYYNASTKNASLYKMNRATNEVIKTISLTSANNMYMYNEQCLMINNVIYIPASISNGDYYKFIINDIDSTFSGSSFNDANSYSIFHYLTPDKKYAFKSYAQSGSTNNSLLNFKVKAYTIKDDYFYQEKVFNNARLMDILNSRCWLSFNEQTGILCACKNDNSAFGVFKYENDDFTTIPIEISASEIPSDVYCAGMSISDDFSTLNIRNKTFKLVQSPDGSYKAINYSKGLTEDVLTGIAQADAENGERFEVITLFPPEIATTVRVKVEGNEPANITQTIVE